MLLRRHSAARRRSVAHRAATRGGPRRTAEARTKLAAALEAAEEPALKAGLQQVLEGLSGR